MNTPIGHFEHKDILPSSRTMTIVTVNQYLTNRAEWYFSDDYQRSKPSVEKGRASLVGDKDG